MFNLLSRRFTHRRLVVIGALCIMALLLPFLLTACGESETAATPTVKPTATAAAVTFKDRTLIYTSFMSNKTLAAQADIAFWDYVTQKTGGKVKVDWRFDGSLNASSEQQSAVIESGLADMGQWSPAYDPARFPLGGVYGVLFVTDKPDLTGKAAIYFMDNYAPWRLEMQKNNLRVLNGYGTGPVQLAGTGSEIRKLEDIAGRKFRATAYLGEAWSGLGGVPVNIAGSEIYNAVAQGTVEGVILAMEHLNVFKLNEHLKYVAGGSGFGIYACTMMAMNLDTWNSFEPELKQICLDARNVGLAKFAELASKQDKEIYDKFKAEGISMYKISATEAQRIKDKLMPAYWDNIKTKMNAVNSNFGDMLNKYADYCKTHVSESTYVDPFDQG